MKRPTFSDNTGSSSAQTNPRIAVLSSNSGGHVQALLDDSVVGPWISLVVAERPEASALNRARWHGVPGVALRAGKSNLDLFDPALVRLLAQHRMTMSSSRASAASSEPRQSVPTRTEP